MPAKHRLLFSSVLALSPDGAAYTKWIHPQSWSTAGCKAMSPAQRGRLELSVQVLYPFISNSKGRDVSWRPSC